MGNKLTVKAATASPPLNVPTPLLDESKNEASSQNNTTSGMFSVPVGRNPGTVEELHKQCKEVFPSNFEGCKVIFNRGLSNHFQISHTINMSNISAAGYRFGVTYVGTNMINSNEAYPILMGDIDPSGNMSANIIHLFHPRLRSKLAAQFQDNKCTGAQVSSDFKGDTYTASCTLANVDLVNKSGIVVGHFLKNLTSKLDLGCEMVTQRGVQVPGGIATAFSLVGRYSLPEHDSIISASLQPTALNLHYYKRLNDKLQAGIELESNLAMGESVASLGYQIDAPSADLTFRGSIDSNWQVGAVLEKKLQPLPLILTLSGTIDHGSKHPTYKFGCGLMVG